MFRQQAEEAAQTSQSSTAKLQQELTTAESALSSATAGWQAEKAALEAAAAAASKAASAEEVERQVQSSIAGQPTVMASRPAILSCPLFVSILAFVDAYA